MTRAYWGFSFTARPLIHDCFKSMQTVHRSSTLFVGVDVHKDTHTAVGVSPFGEKLFELTVGNYEKDFTLLSQRARQVAKGAGLSVRFGLEDCHGYGERLASFL